MKRETFEIKNGIKLHFVKTELFKTNLAAVMITTPLSKENVTENALIPFVLKRGSKNFRTQEEINSKLEEMYGTIYDCGIDKNGDNQIMKFYLENVNDRFLDKGILKESLNLFFDIIFNPLFENNMFLPEYVAQEKENLRKVIDGKIDEKGSYAFNRCVEEMYKSEGYGIYKFGYTENLESITAESISKRYIELINNSKIDIFISGNLNKEEVIEDVITNENIVKLQGRDGEYILNNESTECKENVENPSEVIEKMDVNQGKLVIGLDLLSNMPDFRYVGIVYNAILGDGSNSMLFQNVREKASLAYSARSNFIKQKKNIFIRCGIEIEDYEKALEIIKEQLENIKNGNFTNQNLEDAKRYLESGIKIIENEQDTELVYYFGQEISKTDVTPKEYIEKVRNVTKEQIIEFAKDIQVNTIYFLKNLD